MIDELITPICPERSNYFSDLVRDCMPEIWYRTAFLQMMLTQAAILNSDEIDEIRHAG